MKYRALIFALVVVFVVGIVFHFWQVDSHQNTVQNIEIEATVSELAVEKRNELSSRNIVERIPSRSAKVPSWFPEDKVKNLKWPYLCGDFVDDYASLSAEEVAEKTESDIKAQNVELELIAKKLSYSDDAEHLLMSALYSDIGGSSVDFELLSKAVTKSARHPMITWHLLSACEPGSAERVCSSVDVEKYAAEVDGDNGEVWGKIALRRMRAGDESGAISAMRSANGAPNFTNYFMEHLQLFERGLAASTSYSDVERFVGAMGFTSALTSSASRVYRLCQEQAVNSSEWRTECLRFGKRMDANNGTVLDSLIGLALQRQMYELEADWSNVTNLLDREKYVESEFNKSLWTDAGTVIQFDPRVMSEFVAHWAAHGELSALQFAERETERLKGVVGYNPCEFESTPAP